MVLSLSDAARASASAEAATFLAALVISVVKHRREPASLRLAWSTAGAREKWLVSSKVTCCLSARWLPLGASKLSRISQAWCSTFKPHDRALIACWASVGGLLMRCFSEFQVKDCAVSFASVRNQVQTALDAKRAWSRVWMQVAIVTALVSNALSLALWREWTHHSLSA